MCRTVNGILYIALIHLGRRIAEWLDGVDLGGGRIVEHPDELGYFWEE